MDKKRLTVFISNLGFGGAQNMVVAQLMKMNRERFDVSVILQGAKTGTPLEKKVEALCPVTYLGHYGRITPVTVWKALRALEATKPDVVHSHMGTNGFAAIWSRLFKKPLVITVHSKPEVAFSAKIKKQVMAVLKTKRAKLVAVSEDNARMLKEYFSLDESLYRCVNNGIDLERFTRKDHDGFTVINVARQDENKNHAVLIRCFARLHEKYPGTKLLLLGDGPTHKALQQQVQELKLEDAITLTGNLPNTEDYYAVSDLYVQSSHREAMPMSVLEAMAANLPIVSTDVGGLRDVVQDNGILVPDNDEEALYRAIETIYNQTQEQRSVMCRASNRIVQGYSSEEMARKYEKIYDEMTKVKKL